MSGGSQQTQPTGELALLERCLAAGVAAIVSSVLVNPLEVAKVSHFYLVDAPYRFHFLAFIFLYPQSQRSCSCTHYASASSSLSAPCVVCGSVDLWPWFAQGQLRGSCAFYPGELTRG